MASSTQRDLAGVVGRVSRIKVVITAGSTETTSGSISFTRAFRAAPEVVGINRVDNVSSVITGRVSALSASAFTLTYASSTGSEIFEVVFEGELA